MVSISFYGAAGEVTGSNFLVKAPAKQYVVDCGLFQGSRTFAEMNDEPFPYRADEVDAVFITHAHLDHVGRLPKLVKEGYRGPIYATEATIELSALVLKDALDLAEHRHHDEGKPLLYDKADLRRTLDFFRPAEYGRPVILSKDDKATFFDAGHILGSATVLLEVNGKEIVFSGDIGHRPSILLPEPETPLEADSVVIEATYGGREREDKPDRLQVIKEALEWTVKHNGVLLIPAFSIERTQELLYLLHQLFHRHQLPRLSIFLDSPLAIEALEVFEHHQKLFAANVRRKHQGENIFSFRKLVLTPTVEDSKSIHEHPNPKVVIAGSGMMVGGRIYHHLAKYLDKPNTYLLVIGYQAQGTLGSQIIGGAKKVNIFGHLVEVKANIKVVDVFSGHADNSELIEWLDKIKLKDGKKVFIVHAEVSAAEIFKRELKAHYPDSEVVMAILNSTVEI